MKSYLVTISRGASYTPIIESVIAESQMQAMNHVIQKHRPHYISFINVIESDIARCTSKNKFDLYIHDGLYRPKEQPKFESEISNITVNIEGVDYVVNAGEILEQVMSKCVL